LHPQSVKGPSPRTSSASTSVPQHWRPGLPAPQLAPGHTPDGPVLASIEYLARPGLENELMTAVR
jgi:hypothetical protein